MRAAERLVAELLESASILEAEREPVPQHAFFFSNDNVDVKPVHKLVSQDEIDQVERVAKTLGPAIVYDPNTRQARVFSNQDPKSVEHFYALQNKWGGYIHSEVKRAEQQRKQAKEQAQQAKEQAKQQAQQSREAAKQQKETERQSKRSEQDRRRAAKEQYKADKDAEAQKLAQIKQMGYDPEEYAEFTSGVGGPGLATTAPGTLGGTFKGGLGPRGGGGYGATVSSVKPDSALAKAGLRVGDNVMRVSGILIQGAEHLQRIMRSLTPGTAYPITYARQGRWVKTNITPQPQ